MKYDLVILGAGPGGYQAALKGARNNLRTAVVDAGDIGGTCLNRGCVPTKLFLGATSALAHLESQKRLRLARGQATIDLARLQARKKSIINASRKSMRAGLEKLGVDIFTGRGRLAGPDKIQAGNDQLGFDRLILATGSSSGHLPGLEPDHETVLTSTDALELAVVPESLVIIGAGAVGLEIGQIFHRLGTRITLIEAMDKVAPMEDEQISRELARHLKRERWDIRTGTKVVRHSLKDNRVRVHLDNQEEIEADKCLLALGRKPNSAELDLAAAGISVHGPGWISTDQNLKASQNIYAIGDVNGRSMYAHAATDQAEFVLDHILERTTAPYHENPMPGCVYGSLEIIRTGLTSRELVSAGTAHQVSTATLAANPIIQSHAQVQGFIRVFWSDNRVVGITGIGHGLSSLITLAQVIVSQQWTRKDVHKYVFAHPTLDEALREALLAPYTV
ncbi:MAG: dihydrolipoyl dehydrogenase family protein [Desulfonatronovibrio sp.]